MTVTRSASIKALAQLVDDRHRRGELQVLLINLGADDFHVRRGDRIAQLILAPVARATWREVAELAPTRRATGGFGHTDR